MAHEFGHNYWYGLVASNEAEEAWLDEGLTSYGTTRLDMAEGIVRRPGELLFPPLRGPLGGLFAFPFEERDRLRATIPPFWSSPVTSPSWAYRTLGDYNANSYARPEAALFALEGVVGEETVGRILRTYATLFNAKGQQWALDPPLSGWNAAYLGLVVALFVLWRASLDLARVRLFARRVEQRPAAPAR